MLSNAYTIIKTLKSKIPWSALALGVIFAGCATGGGPQVRIETLPADARIETPTGKEIGQAPLVLTHEQVRELKGESPYLSLRASKEGFDSTTLVLDPKEVEELKVSLNPQKPETFRSIILKNYASDSNQLVVDFLSAQGALGANRLELAEKQINELIKTYPTLAAAFVLEADLRILQNRLDQARSSLVKANRLAPEDPRIIKSLQNLGVKPK